MADNDTRVEEIRRDAAERRSKADDVRIFGLLEAKADTSSQNRISQAEEDRADRMDSLEGVPHSWDVPPVPTVEQSEELDARERIELLEFFQNDQEDRLREVIEDYAPDSKAEDIQNKLDIVASANYFHKMFSRWQSLGGNEEAREIDGSIDNAAGVDLSDVTDINIDVFHLSNMVSKTQAINDSMVYYVEINLSYSTDSVVASSIDLVEDDAATGFPTSNSDKLIYELMETDADKRALIYRGAWTEYDGSNIDVRFSQITAPDVPLGTVRMWDKTTDIPIGWSQYTSMKGFFPVGYNSADSDFDALGNGYNTNGRTGEDLHGNGTNDHDDHALDLGHTHSASTAVCLGEGPAVNLVDGDDDVDDWTASSDNPNDNTDEMTLTHSETDNLPPYSPIMFIKRTAI